MTKKSSIWSSPTATHPPRRCCPAPAPRSPGPSTACAARKLTCKQLPVAAAFHSSLVADAAAPLLAALADIRHCTAGSIPVYRQHHGRRIPGRRGQGHASCWPGNWPAGGVCRRDRGHVCGRRQDLHRGRPRLAPDRTGQGDPRRATSIRSWRWMPPAASAPASPTWPAAWPNWPCSAMPCSWPNGTRAIDRPCQAAGKKPAMTIPLCGANYVKPRPKRPPVTATGPACRHRTSASSCRRRHSSARHLHRLPMTPWPSRCG